MTAHRWENSRTPALRRGCCRFKVMAQLFHPSANTIAKASIVGLVLLIGSAGWAGWNVERSPYITNQGIVQPQPVPFSHEHHVRGLGIDCRHCHTSVEDSAVAGLPTA